MIVNLKIMGVVLFLVLSWSCQKQSTSSKIKGIVVDDSSARQSFNANLYKVRYLGQTNPDFQAVDHFYIGALNDYDNKLIVDEEGASFGIYTHFEAKTQNMKHNDPRLLAPVRMRVKEFHQNELSKGDVCLVDADVEFVYQNIVIGSLRRSGSYHLPEENSECYPIGKSWRAYEMESVDPALTDSLQGSESGKYGICYGDYENTCDITKKVVLDENFNSITQIDISFLEDATILP